MNGDLLNGASSHLYEDDARGMAESRRQQFRFSENCQIFSPFVTSQDSCFSVKKCSCSFLQKIISFRGKTYEVISNFEVFWCCAVLFVKTVMGVENVNTARPYFSCTFIPYGTAWGLIKTIPIAYGTSMNRPAERLPTSISYTIRL